VRKLTLSLAVMAALLPLRGYSLGLGDLELYSALNQELNAEIEVLSATSEDAEQILVKLADRDAFNRAGLDRPFLLQQLKFKLVDKNGVPYVKVYTKAPVREPFLSFLLEIDWPQGHLLREYTLLLDPPVYNNSTPASAQNSSFNQPADIQAQSQPVYAQQQSAQTVNVQTGVISSDSGRSASYEYQAMPVTSASVDQYRVQKNDTLWGIANRMRPDSSISVEQMMLALVRKNPEAFIRENMNGVKRGYILRMPDRENIAQVNRQQAVAQAREHAALWREYSHAAASSSPASSMEADSMGEGMAGDAADQARDADGHLSIMGAGEGDEHTGSNQDVDAQLSQLKQDLAMANEQLESERLEKEDLRSRLAELEQRVKSVIEGSGRVEMDDSELAKLQQDLQSTQQAVQESPTEDSNEGTSEESVLNDEPITDEVMSEDALATEDMPEEIADDMVGDTQEKEDAIFADEITAEAETEVIDDGMADTHMPAESPEPVNEVAPPAFAKQQPKGFIEGLLDDPKLLGMIGGGLAFIFLLVALLLKRIRGNKTEEDEWAAGMEDPSSSTENDFSGISGAELGDNSANATLQSEGFNTDQTAEIAAAESDDGMDITRVKVPESDGEDTVFNIDDADARPEDDDRDDVIAEADVYLAYGIYQQAEELLNTAIDQNPERDDYRMKLLETYYAAKNAAAFEELAVDVKSRKGDDKAYWSRVVAMGMELSPTNELFSSTENVLEDFDANALLPDKLQTTDLDLDAGDDFDLGLDSDLGDADLDSSDLGESGFDDADLEDTFVSAEPVEVEEEAKDTEELDLASDLENITSDLDRAEVAEPAADADDNNSELEFDLGDMDDVGSAEAESTETTEMDIDDDFSLDFDAADLGFEEAEDETQDEVELDADLNLGGDLDDEQDNSQDDGLGDESVEIDLSEDLDLSDIDELDLSDSSDLDVADVNVDVSDGDDEEFDISELSEDVDEVSTKLDLAKAYIDMGDNDGARSILEEVKAEGNDEQQKQAEELIQKAS